MNISNWPLKSLLSLGLFVVLAVVFNWSVASDPFGTLPLGDPYLNLWIMEYASEAVIDNPSALFDAPVFHPHRNTLAFSENLIGIVPVYAVADAFLGSPVASYNFCFLLAYALSGFFTYLLARELGAGYLASLFAGVVFGFSHPRLGQLYHLHLVWIFLIPLALFFLIRFFRNGGWSNLVWFTVTILFQSYGSLHGMVLILMSTAILISGFLLATKNIRRSVWSYSALLLALVCIVPILIPYFNVKEELALERDAAEIQRYSPDIRAVTNSFYFSNSLPAKVSPRTGDLLEHALFPGYAILMALTAYSFIAGRKRPFTVWSVIICCGAAFLLASFVWLWLSLPGADIMALLFRSLHLMVVIPLLLIASLALKLYFEQNTQPRYSEIFLLLGLISFFFVLGPKPYLGEYQLGEGLYSLFMLLPGANGIRVPSRFIHVTVLALAVIAAMGITRSLARMNTTPLVRRLVGILLIALALYEYYPGAYPLPKTHDWSKPVYHWLKKQNEIETVLEFPLPERAYEQTYFMLGNRIHGKTIVNGYSGYTTPELIALRRATELFPSGASLKILRSINYDALILNKTLLSSRQQKQWEKQLVRRPGITVLHQSENHDVVSIDKGGRGYSLEFRWEHTGAVSFLARVVGRVKGIEPYLLFRHATESEKTTINHAFQDYKINLQDTVSNPPVLHFAYQYHFSEPPTDQPIPLDLKTFVSSDNPGNVSLFVNGRFLEADKGYNLYCFDNRGALLDAQNFNTSWYERESERLAKYVKNTPETTSYLVGLTRFDASRSLTTEAVKALQETGLSTDLRGKLHAAHFFLVDLNTKSVIAEKSGIDGFEYSSGDPERTRGIEIRQLQSLHK